MRLTEGLGLDSSMPAIKPTSEWRITSKAEERIMATASETRWYRVLGWTALVLGIVFLFTFARVPRDAESHALMVIKAYFLIVISQLVLIGLYRRLSCHIPLGPGLRRIQLKLPDVDACPVRIDIKQSGVLTGTDEGFMWVEEGTLYFKGLQTVFRINREDVPPLGLWPRRIRPQPSQGKLPDTIPLPVNDRQVEVSLCLIDPFEDFNSRRRAHQFQANLYEWLSQRPAGSLESLVPPLDLHPSLAYNRKSRIETLFASALLVGINAALLIMTDWPRELKTPSSVIQFLMLLANVALLIWSAGMLRQAWRDHVVRTRLTTSGPSF